MGDMTIGKLNDEDNSNCLLKPRFNNTLTKISKSKLKRLKKNKGCSIVEVSSKDRPKPRESSNWSDSDENKDRVSAILDVHRKEHRTAENLLRFHRRTENDLELERGRKKKPLRQRDALADGTAFSRMKRGSSSFK